MAEEGACPICGFERLLTNQDNCPQCDADLTCFKVLDSIPEELTQPVSEPSSLVAVQREPSIAALEQESPASVSKVKLESAPESSATDSDLIDMSGDAPAEEAAHTSETPSSKPESKQSIPAKPSAELKKRLISKGTAWNYTAAMLTFAVILIAIVAVFQLYHLRRLESDLQEQSQNQKIVLKSEQQKRASKPVTPESVKVNPPKADSTPVVKKIHPATASKPDKSYSDTEIQKPEKQSEFSESKDTTAKTRDAKPTSLPEHTENMAEPQIQERLSEHDFQRITIKTGDTLKSVAETHYGAAKYYPLLIMLNPNMPIDLKDGTGRLKIIKDRGKAAGLYREKTSKIGNRLYFSYTITQGDTLKTIALKFYRSKSMIKSILDLNPDSRFRAGEQIKIRLE